MARILVQATLPHSKPKTHEFERDWEPPYRLTYDQVEGPYRWFRHEHLFEAEAGGTRVVDKVIYRAPGGRPIDLLLVRPDLERIFKYRADAARRVFGLGRDRRTNLERPDQVEE